MRQPRFLSPHLALVLAVLVVGCGGAADDGESLADHQAEQVPASEATDHGITLTPMPDSPEFPGATLTLAESAERSGGANTFEFAVEGYELGSQTPDAGENGLANSGKGQHIHFIVDNGPYSAHYEPTAEVEMTEGSHVVLAFLSRSYHESVKEPSAYLLRQVQIGDGEADEIDLSGPHMFYSRPKGTYSGADTERLMLDFYLVNTEISATGNRVRATINGAEFEITEWVPHVIEGLPLGEVEIALELVDAAGNAVPGPFNQVTRTVTLAPAE